jgi:hypothetical protein
MLLNGEKKMNKTIKKTLLISLITIMLISTSISIAGASEITPPNWNVSGTWDLQNTSHDWPIPDNGYYLKTMKINQNIDGTIIGSGNNLPPGHLWDVTGSVTGDSITLALAYSTIENYVATFVGTIDASGQMSGRWSDSSNDYGLWNTIKGQAVPNSNYVPPGENVAVNPGPNVFLTFDLVTGQGTATVETTNTPPTGYP